MAAAQLATVLDHLRHLAEVRRADALADADLLARFVARREESAFAALLQRHGPMVLGVCRRILGNAHDAEDAFQATFLVLVRKAGSIGKGSSLGYWLYEVAYRTALRAKVSAARRLERERRATAMTDPDPITDRWEELQPLLDEELNRLPEKYREPFVLCYLQGKTHGEAAELLGWPKGTVSGRLARAREALRARLARRGVTLTAGGLVTALARAASAEVPRRLAGATLTAALCFASGRAAGGLVSAEAVTLAKGVLQGMSTNKLKFALAVLVTAGVLGLGAVMSAWPAGGQPPPADPPAKAVVGQAPALPAGATARMGTADFRHGDGVFFVAYTPDGKHLVTAARDQTLRLWDAATGKQLRRFDRPSRAGGKIPPPAGGGAVEMPLSTFTGLFPVALSPDGKTLADARGTAVFLWDVASGKPRRQLAGASFGASTLGFAEGSKHLVLAAQGKVYAWEVATGKRLRAEEGAMPRSVGISRGGESAFSPDGKLLARLRPAQQKGLPSIRVTEVATGKEVADIPSKVGNSAVTFAPDGKRLAWATGPGAVKVWDLAAGKVAVELPGGGRIEDRVSSLAFSPDGKTLAVSRTGSQLELWDLATRQQRVRVGEADPPPHVGRFVLVSPMGDVPRPVHAAFSPDGKTVAFCSGASVRLLNVATGKVAGPGSGGHPGAVSSLALTPDGKTLVSHVPGDGVRLWDAATGKALRRVSVAGAATAALSPDGAVLAVGAGRDAVALVEAATGKELRKLRLEEPGVGGLTFSPDGKALAVCGQRLGMVQVYDVATGKLVKEMADGPKPKPGDAVAFTVRSGGRGAPSRAVAFSPDGKLLVAVGSGNRLGLWDATTGRKVRDFARGNAPPPRHFAFTPDGYSLAAVNGNGTVTLFETASGEQRGRFGKPGARPYLGQEVTVRQGGGFLILGGLVPEGPFRAAFSPDGRVLAAATGDATVWLWDVATGKELKRFDGHQGGVVSLTFARDGTRLASGSRDTTALVWDTGALLPKAGPGGGEKLKADAAEGLWADLASKDAGLAFEAIRKLWAAPAAATGLLRRHLKAVPAPDPKEVKRLLAELNGKNFTARRKAADELEKLGELVGPELRAALPKADSLEMRQRLERLLKRLEAKSPPAETLRQIRAVEVLERVDSAEAQALLRELATGAPGARLTRAARAALQRLGQRAAPR